MSENASISDTGDGPGGTSHFAEEIRRFVASYKIINPTKL
jgi:hypothetical protein